ncbi:MAG TPA: helix-turn-helix domain-containing protein [Patescibacteria group bacterium]|nr:helix-turn-helix domain-containing protein [Patescibacteria group bacterium]
MYQEANEKDLSGRIPPDGVLHDISSEANRMIQQAITYASYGDSLRYVTTGLVMRRLQDEISSALRNASEFLRQDSGKKNADVIPYGEDRGQFTYTHPFFIFHSDVNEIEVDGVRKKLKPNSAELLRLLSGSPNSLVTYETFQSKIGNSECDYSRAGSHSNVNSHVKYLRDDLDCGRELGTEAIIITVRDRGYMLIDHTKDNYPPPLEKLTGVCMRR